MPKDDKYSPPEPSTSDAAHAVARSGLGTIPIAGTAAVELLNALVTPPLERRRQQWMESIGEGLRRLEDKRNVDLEALRDNDQFIDIAMQASQAAIRTAQEEKLQALRNALLNSALPNPPEETLQQMFINFIDTLSVWHIRLLGLFQGPEQWAQRSGRTFPDLSMGGLATLVESAFPDLRGRRDLYDQIGKDLAFRGLAQTDNLHVTMTGHGLMQKRTTQMGDAFLSFIQDPLRQ